MATRPDDELRILCLDRALGERTADALDFSEEDNECVDIEITNILSCANRFYLFVRDGTVEMPGDS